MSPKAGDGEVDTDDSDSPVCTSSIVCPLSTIPGPLLIFSCTRYAPYPRLSARMMTYDI